MPKTDLSDDSKQAQEELKRRNKKQRDDQKQLNDAIREASIQKRLKAIQPYTDSLDQRKYNQKIESDRLWQKLDEYVEQHLASPDAASYVEWKTAMMKIVTACTHLNAALFSHNLQASDLIFYAVNYKSALENKKITWRKRVDAVKDFFGAVGTLPENFDPHFSVHAKMENGRAYGKLYSGENAETVNFPTSATEFSPPDVFLGAFLKEETPYELVTDPNSRLFRKVVKKEDDPDELYEYLRDHPEAMKDVQIEANDPDNMNPNWKNYRVQATGFKVDPNTVPPNERYLLEAKETYYDLTTKKKVERTIHIPMFAEPDNLNYGEDAEKAHYFTGTMGPREGGIDLKFHLPAKQVSSQDELDEILGDEFHDYCQRKLNEMVVDFKVDVKISLDGDGKPSIDIQKLINGKPYPIGEPIASQIKNDLSQKLDGMLASAHVAKDHDGKLYYTNRFKLPEGLDMHDDLTRYFESKGYDVKSVIGNNRVIFTKPPSTEEIEVKIKLQEGSKTDPQYKFVITGSDPRSLDIRVGDEIVSNKEQHDQYLTAKELDDEFGPRLKLEISERVKHEIEGITTTPLNLYEYNPNGPSGPRP